MLGKSPKSCRAGAIVVPLMLGLLASQGCESPPDSSAVVFEGARLIVGDGSPPIENAALVVDGGRLVQVGSAAELDEWAGAERVDLAGMTVMPAIIDTHTHLNQERDALIQDLRARARIRGERRDESWARYARPVDPRGRDSWRGPLSLRGRRDHLSRTRTLGDPLLGEHQRRSPPGGPG